MHKGFIRLGSVEITSVTGGFGERPPSGRQVGTVIAIEGDSVIIDFETPAAAAERMTAEAVADEE